MMELEIEKLREATRQIFAYHVTKIWGRNVLETLAVEQHELLAPKQPLVSLVQEVFNK